MNWSKEFKYGVQYSDEGDDDSDAFLPQSRTGLRKSGSTWSIILLIVTALIILVETTAIVYLHKTNVHTSPNGLDLRRTKPRIVYEPSIVTSPNETVASAAWDGILAGHGVVAIDPEYARQQKLPPTSFLPAGRAKGQLMYTLEAYHAMHCIASLRNHFISYKLGTAWGWDEEHDNHCFDAVRQYIMCNIDDTLLYTTGHRDAGIGQSKMCHDWDALRAWAEERSADYFDFEPGTPGIEGGHLGKYHAGDGLPVGSLS